MAKTKRKTALGTEHPAIALYYGTLAEYRDQRVHHEGAVSTAFENLLTALAKQRGWVFIPLLAVIGKRIVPDGTIRDGNGLPRAYWEAKDTNDDLDAEIAKKIKKGYPLNNIIFEDTREAVLYQGGEKIDRYDLGNATRLVELLTRFLLMSSQISRGSKPRSRNSRTAYLISLRAYSKKFARLRRKTPSSQQPLATFTSCARAPSIPKSSKRMWKRCLSSTC